ncbi:MAG: helix-turn-helix transcriptional regulator [Nitrospira sp.]|nr:helix-turn-helix transcriptional regulator [Nitrospira sp.]
MFELTPQQVIEHCRRNGHCLSCAGQALALRACMERLGWSISELAEHSGVSRSHLSEILMVKTSASLDVLDALAASVGLQFFELCLLAAFCLRSELSG